MNREAITVDVTATEQLKITLEQDDIDDIIATDGALTIEGVRRKAFDLFETSDAVRTGADYSADIDGFERYLADLMEEA